MNHTSELFDDRIADWLEDDPVHAPAQLLETVLAAVPQISQRRATPWSMPRFASARRLGLALAILVVGALLIALGGLVVGPPPGPSPSPPFGLTQSFTSTQHGFSIAYGADWTVSPATKPWPMGTDAALPPDPMLDAFTIPATTMTFVVISQPLAAGVAPEAWLATYEASYPTLPTDCWPAPASMERVSIDGQDAWIHGGLLQCQFTEAITFSGGRVYEFTGYAVANIFDRALFDALLATAHLDPASGTSASVTPTGAPTQPAGAPLPDELIGAWHHPAPGWWWFVRAGDPECAQAVRTQGDCVFWQRGTTPAEIGAAAMVDGNLEVAWKSGFCTQITSTYSVALVGDSLNLVDIGGGCEGGNFGLTRAATGSAPTAPPPPAP